MKTFDPGFNIEPKFKPLGFEYGEDCFGPQVENRSLDSIRGSLLDPDCGGPEVVYAMAMDVGKNKHRELLNNMHLLFGAVTYAEGRLGREPIRSQGHVHQRSDYGKGWSTPEVYQIWTGRAVIYMQESAQDDPGRCFAVYATPGEVVVVPPGWAHATISADPASPLTFGAWCNREYGFDYDLVREHHGLAWYPVLDEKNNLTWIHNSNYANKNLEEKDPNDYEDLGLIRGMSIYSQFEANPESLLFVPRPSLMKEMWKGFIP